MKITGIIFVIFLMVACDPPKILIVENHSGQDVTLHVNTKRSIQFDSVQYSDTIISDELIKLNTISKYFDKKLKIGKVDSVNYYFTLKPNFEILVAPSTIGIPFNSVTYMINDRKYEIFGESIRETANIRIKTKPLRTTIIKILE